MSIIITKCKNCEFCKKIKALSGMKYICSKTNQKVRKNYYCGKVPMMQVKIPLEDYYMSDKKEK